MPVEVVLVLAWYFVRRGHVGGAFILLAGFDCFLRTGEMLGLALADVSFGSDGRGALNLGFTKSGKRHGAFEASTVNDPLCGRVFQRVLAGLPSGTSMDNYVFRGKTHRFYALFHAGIRWLGLESYGFLPYSIRRGGATAFFRATRSMEAALDRGRWSSARVARIYLNDGIAREVELRFSPAIVARLRLYAAALQQ